MVVDYVEDEVEESEKYDQVRPMTLAARREKQRRRYR